MLLFYIVSSNFNGINFHRMIFLEFCDRALLPLSRLQMLVATKKEGGGGSEVNGQIPSRSSDIFADAIFLMCLLHLH